MTDCISGLMVAAERRQEFRVRLQKRARRRAERRADYLEDEKNWKEVTKLVCLAVYRLTSLYSSK